MNSRPYGMEEVERVLRLDRLDAMESRTGFLTVAEERLRAQLALKVESDPMRRTMLQMNIDAASAMLGESA